MTPNRLLVAPFLLGALISQGAVAQERTLQVVAPWEVASLEPVKTGYVFARMQVLETLVTANDRAEAVAAIAEAWTLSADRLSWQFVLRPGATFHDGTPVTAAAVVASLERARGDAGVLSRIPGLSFRADGDRVVAQTGRPFAAMNAFLANYTAVVLAPGAYDDKGAVHTIIGTGPYRVTGFTPPLKVEVERFEAWRGTRPAIARATYLAAGQGETRALMAESGTADLVFALAASSVDRLKRVPAVEVKTITVPRTRLMKVNVGSPYFSDLRARQAFSLALDREGMATAILRNPAAVATQVLPPAMAGWHAPNLSPLRHDPAEARRLLSASGWVPGPDSILRKDGIPFKVTLRTFPSWPELPVIATAMQAQLREVGIDLEVRVGNSSDIVAGHKDGTLHVGLMSRNFSLVPDPLGTLLEDFGPNGGEFGAMNWTNAELVGLLDTLGGTFDPQARLPIQRRVAEILHAELPVIPVSWFDLSVAANKRITGVEVDPFELSYRLTSLQWSK